MIKVLKSIQQKINQRLEKRDEQGAGLITILGVTMVLLVVVATVTSSTAMSTTFTYSNLNAQQADDYADTAFTEALGVLSNTSTGKVCNNSNYKKSPTADEPYGYTIYRSSNTEAPKNTGDPQVTPGCPIKEITKWIMVESYGVNRDGEAKKVQTGVFKIAGAGDNVIPHGLTSGTLNVTGMKTMNMDTASGLVSPQPSIYISSPNASSVNCEDPDIYLNANVYWANNVVRFFDCNLRGDLKATSGLSVRSEVQGDVYSKANINNTGNKIRGKISRNTADDALNFYGTMYGYRAKSADYTITKTSECNDSFNMVQKYLNANPGPKIIDLKACGNWNLKGAKELTVSDDVTILFSKISIAELQIKSKADKQVTVNLVKESAVADDDSSTCSATETGNFTKSSFNEGVHGIIYTPCSISIQGSKVVGQVYAGGNIEFKNSGDSSATPSSFTYMPSSLPNAEIEIRDIGQRPDLIRVS